MPLKCKIRTSIGIEGLQDITIMEGTQSKFPREVNIRIYSNSKLGNWLLKHFLLPKKLFLTDITILGW